MKKAEKKKKKKKKKKNKKKRVSTRKESQRCLNFHLPIQVRIFSFSLANKSTCSEPTGFPMASNIELLTSFAWFTHLFTPCRSTSEYIEWRSAASDNITMPQPGTKQIILHVFYLLRT
jgi:hypothetical protein